MILYTSHSLRTLHPSFLNFILMHPLPPPPKRRVKKEKYINFQDPLNISVQYLLSSQRKVIRMQPATDLFCIWKLNTIRYSPFGEFFFSFSFFDWSPTQMERVLALFNQCMIITKQLSRRPKAIYVKLHYMYCCLSVGTTESKHILSLKTTLHYLLFYFDLSGLCLFVFCFALHIPV